MIKFETALKRHAIVSDINNRWVGQTTHQAALEGAWAAATATKDNGVAMASAVRTTIPVDFIPLFRSYDATPAGFFLECLSEVMRTRAVEEKGLKDVLVCSNLALEAFKAFEERRQQADTIEEGFGCDRSAAWGTLRKCDDKSASVMKQMLEIAALAGRMFREMQYEGIPHRVDDPEEITGVKGGDDLDLLTEEERCDLNHERTRGDVLERLDDKQAQQMEMSAEVLHGRGPLVMLLDSSGSMHRERQVWSKACAIALARIAHSEQRLVRVVHFSSTTSVCDLDAGDVDDLRELAWYHLGGGTCIDTAMSVGFEQCVQLRSEGVEGADIVCITDGECHHTPTTFEAMHKDGVDLWTIAIDVDFKKPHGTQVPLVHYARKYMHISDQSLGMVGGVADFKESALNNDHRGLN